MSTGELIVIAVRILVPLLILRYPLAGGLAAVAVDALDVVMIELIGLGGFGAHYAQLDKLLDTYYLTLELIVALRWESAWARVPAIALYVYRLVGVILFEITDARWLLLAVPEHVRELVAVLRLRRAVLPEHLPAFVQDGGDTVRVVADPEALPGMAAALSGGAALGLDQAQLSSALRDHCARGCAGEEFPDRGGSVDLLGRCSRDVDREILRCPARCARPE